jgi:ComF family protein
MGILDFFFPKKCAGCGKYGTYFCLVCAKSARLYSRKFLPACGGKIRRLRVIWKYEGAPKKLIHKLKYKFVREVAETLAQNAAVHLTRYKHTKFLLVPIPLHWTRRNWRGFNHTEEIGKILAGIMGWECQNLLIRTRFTFPQVGLSKEERKENVVGVFKVSSSGSFDALPSTPVLLFDDVWTTGSTMLEAVRTLKHAGFKKISCLALMG